MDEQNQKNNKEEGSSRTGILRTFSGMLNFGNRPFQDVFDKGV